jgi:hypothetical protein
MHERPKIRLAVCNSAEADTESDDDSMFAYPSCLPSATATPGSTLDSTISGSALKRTLKSREAHR